MILNFPPKLFQKNMKIHITTREREDQAYLNFHDRVWDTLDKEIKSRKFKNDESLEFSLDSVCFCVAQQLGAYLEIPEPGTYVFDFTRVYYSPTGRIVDMSRPSMWNTPGSLGDFIDKAFFK